MLRGSVGVDVARHAGCPVFVARAKDHGLAVPEIEPACPACLAVQRDTAGAALWCERHRSRHAHGRLHHALGQAVTSGSSQFIRV